MLRRARVRRNTRVRVHSTPLFVLCLTSLPLHVNSARLELSVAHKFKLIMMLDVGTDLHARCPHVYKVSAVESS